MDEFQFIDHIKQKTYKQPSLIKGIGDDAAVFRELAKDTVVAVDTFVEDIHFSNKTMSPYHIGYRTLAANISDMAAMGAQPTYYLVSIVVPKAYSEADLSEIYRGMLTIASNYHMDLIGGDTVSGDSLVLTITIIGTVEKNKARYRHTAQQDDTVFVTGTLGDSRAGLHILLNDLHVEERDYFIKRHQLPEPRVEFAQLLGQLKHVTLNDVSDGIASEAAEIASASNVSIVLLNERIPIHEAFDQFSPEHQHEWKYFSGEDFELIGTVAKHDWIYVQECAKRAGISVTEIGYVTNQEETVYVKYRDKIKPLKKRGYTHLK